MLERKKLNLRIDADLDICLLIISQGLGERKFSECVEGILNFLPPAPVGVQVC